MHVTAFHKLSNEHSYKFSRILTLTVVISISILRMRIVSDDFLLVPCYLFPFKNCPMNVLTSLAEF